MCWSFTASGFFAIMGFVFAGYFAYKKESKLLWIPLAFFGLMEGLQAITYFYIGDCTSTQNQVLTFLSYLHISFQPIFINAMALYFIPERFRKKIIGWVFVLASLMTVLLIMKLYPFTWAGTCSPIEDGGLCGEKLCSVKGDWHLAWEIPLNGLKWFGSAYPIGFFIIPLLYGAWRTAIFTFIFGPGLVYFLTNNSNEFAAIWCLMSVGIIIAISTPWLRNKLHVRKWYFWHYPHQCNKCKKWWIPKDHKHPIKCPYCKTKYWNISKSN